MDGATSPYLMRNFTFSESVQEDVVNRTQDEKLQDDYQENSKTRLVTIITISNDKLL